MILARWCQIESGGGKIEKMASQGRKIWVLVPSEKGVRVWPERNRLKSAGPFVSQFAVSAKPRQIGRLMQPGMTGANANCDKISARFHAIASSTQGAPSMAHHDGGWASPPNPPSRPGAAYTDHYHAMARRSCFARHS